MYLPKPDEPRPVTRMLFWILVVLAIYGAGYSVYKSIVFIQSL